MSDFKYHRVSSRFWTDEKVLKWDDDTRLLALYLMTSPHRRTEGIFRIPKPYIAADLGWSMERLAKPFAQLLMDGFMKYDETVGVMLFPNALKYNAPENKNQAIAAARAVAELPETPLLTEFIQLAERYSERLAEQLRQVIGNTQAQAQTQTQTPPPTRGGGRAGQSSAVETRLAEDHERDTLPPPDLGEPHDDMTLQDVCERYRQHIGLMGRSVVERWSWWNEEHGVSFGVIAKAIDETVAAREAGRCTNPDAYIDGIIRHRVNDGVLTVAEWQKRGAKRTPRERSPTDKKTAKLAAMFRQKADEMEAERGVKGA